MNCEDSVYKISCELQNVTEAIGQSNGWEITGIVVTGIAAIGTLLISLANLALLRTQHAIKKEATERETYIRRKTFTSAMGNFCALATLSREKEPSERLLEESRKANKAAFLAVGAVGEKSADNLFSHLSRVVRCVQAGDSDEIVEAFDNYIGASLAHWEDDPDSDFLPMPEVLQERYQDRFQ